MNWKMGELIDKPGSIRKGEELESEKIKNFLKEKIPELKGEFRVEQFPRGYSNLTYLVKFGEREMVLRRPPFGSKVKSAHDMAREFRIISALYPVYPKVPKPILFCEDENLIGAKFYVMERIKGVILRNEVPDGIDFSDETASRLSESFIKNLAELHSIDYKRIGLGELGKPEGFLKRQVQGWADRYMASKTEDIPEITRVVSWLKEKLPCSPDPCLIHNDYKYDNLILDPKDITKIIGVLDWEMSTIGDPLVDLGMALGYWVDEKDPDELKKFAFGPTAVKGSYSRRELAERYSELTGIDISNIHYYVCLGFFKIAVIIQQIYYRYVKGFTSDERFASLIEMVKICAKMADEVSQKEKI